MGLLAAAEMWLLSPAGVRALARPCHRSQYTAPILEHNEEVIITIGSLQTLMPEVNAEACPAG